MTSCKLLPNHLLQNSITVWGLGFQHMDWGGERQIVDNILLKVTQRWCMSMQSIGTQLKSEEVFERGVKGVMILTNTKAWCECYRLNIRACACMLSCSSHV